MRIRSTKTKAQVRILVVDDSRDAADGLAAVLATARYDTRVAYDGKHAMEVAATFRPHVVFLDIDMPRMNGYATAQRLRHMASNQPPVLIAHTAHSNSAAIAAATQAGFDLHLVKPCDVLYLLDLLKRTVAKLRACRAHGRRQSFTFA
jgi:CheY-like chemotaxis protein